MVRTYRKIHESKEVAKVHVAKIQARGGQVKQSVKDGKILLEYSFPANTIPSDFKKLIEQGKKYNTPIDADLINSKSKKGHTLDNLPKSTDLIMVDSLLFEKEKSAFGKVQNHKIAFHNRPIDDTYWNKQIERGVIPPILIEFDEDNNQLRVRDGNHRLNVLLNKGVKQIPTVLTINAKKYLMQK
jgi:hypothetical protein